MLQAYKANKRKISAGTVINRVMLVIFLIFTLVPFYVLIVNSFKTQNQLLGGVLFFSYPLYWKNYSDAFVKMLPFIWNSVTVTVVSTAGVTFLAALCGYAFGHYVFRGKRVLFAAILVNMMIPSILTLVPSYLVIMPYVAGGSVMGIYLVRGFVEQLPKTVFEAAKIDGISEFRCFISIGIPLLGTILTTVSILALLNFWNDIVWPMLVIEKSALKTIPLGLLEFNQQQGSNKGALFAGYILASIPLLVYFALNMRSFMDSLTEGAIK